MLEEDIKLLILCLAEYIKNIDGEEFKKIFLGYVEYMARNYGQSCFIDEYDQMIVNVTKFADKHHLNIEKLTPYKRNLFYRWIKEEFKEEDILELYYFNGKDIALELFIDRIESKYS